MSSSLPNGMRRCYVCILHQASNSLLALQHY